jgi:hypothetical protein
MHKIDGSCKTRILPIPLIVKAQASQKKNYPLVISQFAMENGPV